MDEKTLSTLRALFIDTRLLCGQGDAPPDERFVEALSMLDDSRAGVFFRYCCAALRELARDDRPAAYAFADTVHNAPRFEGLNEGRLALPRWFWEQEVGYFREQHGAHWFSDFEGDVVADDSAETPPPRRRRFLRWRPRS